MNLAAFILTLSLLAIPVSDTGTGTPCNEYIYQTVEETQVIESTETEVVAEQIVYDEVVSEREISMLAYLVDKEIGGGTLIEKQAVVWCVLNRVDKGSRNGFKDTVYGVLTQQGQFRSSYGYGSSSSVAIVKDVLAIWYAEKYSTEPVYGRILPKDYCWYYGDGRHNHFRNAYKGGTEWDWAWTGGY